MGGVGWGNRWRKPGGQLYAVGNAGGGGERDREREKWTRVLMDGPDGGREQSGMNALLCGARAESFARRSLRDRVHGWKLGVCLDSFFSKKTSHRIFEHMHKILNKIYL